MAPGKIVQRLLCFGKGKHLVDRRPDLPGFDELANLRELLAIGADK